MELRGVLGTIDWYYYQAATVHAYVVVRDVERGGFRLTGTVGERDAFKLSQRPLEFVAPHKNGAFRWPVLDFSISESGRLTARLGAEVPASPLALQVTPGKDLTVA
jgi:hypothetical protein